KWVTRPIVRREAAQRTSDIRSATPEERRQRSIRNPADSRVRLRGHCNCVWAARPPGQDRRGTKRPPHRYTFQPRVDKAKSGSGGVQGSRQEFEPRPTIEPERESDDVTDTHFSNDIAVLA